MGIETASFYTVGCKLNQSETDTLQSQFVERGVVVKPFGKAVDLTVINTCSVTSAADRDCRNAIRRAKLASPAGQIAVMGCYAELKPEVLKKEGADYIFGTTNKENLLELLPPLRPSSPPSPLSPSRTRAFLKIQDGCSNFCTYCIVPYARGTPRSRDFDEAVAEAKRLVALDYPEIVLTGVNIGDYSCNNRSLLHLVDAIQNIPGLKRLRLSSIEPNTLSIELIKLIAASHVICPHLHVPLQSGNNKQLRAMGRKYTTQEFAALLKQIEESLPDAGLGTDIITGFPGETDEDFEQTFSFVSTLPLNSLHMFSYSDRPGTAASELTHKVPAITAKQRTRRLIEWGEQKKKDFAQRFVGRKMPVLFDQYKDGIASGYTPNYIRIETKSDTDLRKQIVDIIIQKENLKLHNLDTQTLTHSHFLTRS